VAFHFIGGEELALGFRFVGIAGTVARTEDEARAAFAAATRSPGVKVVILTEQVSAMMPADVMAWQMSGAYPLIVEIPDISGHRDNRTSLIDSIRDAVGLHV
jgi:vacuolar-type H+-ATPase subunit F/Vma7